MDFLGVLYRSGLFVDSIGSINCRFGEELQEEFRPLLFLTKNDFLTGIPSFLAGNKEGY